MNLEHLRGRLLAAARAHPPGERVPYAFEKRIMARLGSQRGPDAWGLWARALWRAAVSCVAVTVLVSAWMFVATEANGFTEVSLNQQLESTVYAPIEQQLTEAW